MHIIIHAGLHKTGSTYIQKNLYTSRKALQKAGIGYLGHRELVSIGLFNYIKTGRFSDETDSKAQACFTNSINSFSSEGISTILISDERILGNLKEGYESERKPSKQFLQKKGFYSDAFNRADRIMGGMHKLLGDRPERITFFLYKRNITDFAESIYSQLLKEHVDVSEATKEEFISTSDWEHYQNIEQTLNPVVQKYKGDLKVLDYNDYADTKNPSSILFAFLNTCLDDSMVKTIVESLSSQYISCANINPSLSSLGTQIAKASRRVFNNREEWMRFRKILEQYYPKKK